MSPFPDFGSFGLTAKFRVPEKAFSLSCACLTLAWLKIRQMGTTTLVQARLFQKKVQHGSSNIFSGMPERLGPTA